MIHEHKYDVVIVGAARADDHHVVFVFVNHCNA